MSYERYERNITNGNVVIFGTGDLEDAPFEHNLETNFMSTYMMLGSDISDLTLFYGIREDIHNLYQKLIKLPIDTPELFDSFITTLYFVLYDVPGSDKSVLISNWNLDEVGDIEYSKDIAMFYCGGHHSDLDYSTMMYTILSKNKHSKGMKRFNSIHNMDTLFECISDCSEEELWDEHPTYRIKKEMAKFNILKLIRDCTEAFISISDEYVSEYSDNIENELRALKEYVERAIKVQDLSTNMNIYHHCRLECKVGTANKYYQMDYAQSDKVVDVRSGRIDTDNELHQERVANTPEEAAKIILELCAKKIKMGGYEIVSMV